VQYAGTADGRLFSSSDNWRTVQTFSTGQSAEVTSISADPRDARFAVATFAGLGRGRVFRTFNGGAFWDDLSETLPPVGVHSAVTDRATSSIYLATDAGVFYSYLENNGQLATPWILVKASEGTPVLDVALDGSGSQLYALFEGIGVFAALAPHRLRDPRVLSAGDFTVRAAAP
jgi:photosystem II stability/assembly factor-like uncharacterized protein